MAVCLVSYITVHFKPDLEELPLVMGRKALISRLIRFLSSSLLIQKTLFFLELGFRNIFRIKDDDHNLSCSS